MVTVVHTLRITCQRKGVFYHQMQIIVKGFLFNTEWDSSAILVNVETKTSALQGDPRILLP